MGLKMAVASCKMEEHYFQLLGEKIVYCVRFSG